MQFITAKYGAGKDSFGEPKHLPTDDDDYISEDGSGSDDISSSLVKWSGEERFIYPVPFHCTQSGSNQNFNVSKLNFIKKFQFFSFYCTNLFIFKY